MKKSNNNFSKKYNLGWVLTISIWTFLLAIIFSIIAENSIDRLGIISSFLILLLIILIGIVFDIIGIAVTRAEEKPYHSMAAKKIKEGKIAIKIVRNASQVSNFCNDVVGDISGIISGAIGATLIFKLSQVYKLGRLTFLSILMTALTASLTVGGKALGKSYALLKYEEIVLNLAKLVTFLEDKFKIKLVKDKR